MVSHAILATGGTTRRTVVPADGTVTGDFFAYKVVQEVTIATIALGGIEGTGAAAKWAAKTLPTGDTDLLNITSISISAGMIHLFG